MLMESLFEFIKSAPIMTSLSRFWMTKSDHRKVFLLMTIGTVIMPCTFRVLPCTSVIRSVEGSTLIPRRWSFWAIPVDIAEWVAPESNSVLAWSDIICTNAIGLGSRDNVVCVVACAWRLFEWGPWTTFIGFPGRTGKLIHCLAQTVVAVAKLVVVVAAVVVESLDQQGVHD